jgi:hypothetical protein
MGQLDSTCTAPHQGVGHVALAYDGLPGLEVFPPQPVAEETPLGRRRVTRAVGERRQV